MNPHVIQGTIAFVIWSTFASWYYVNHLFVEDQSADIPSKPVVEQVQPQEEPLNEEVIDSIQKIAPIPIDYSATVFFRLDQSQILDRSRLSELIDSLKKLPSEDQYSLRIIGHTCDLGSFAYNDSLSKARARTVAEFLSGYLNENTTLTVLGKGESSPANQNTSEQMRAKNRRVEVTLTN